MPTNVYGPTLQDIFAGSVKTGDAFKAMLVSSAYTPNFDTHHFLSDGPRTNEVTGTGYTAGGVTVTLGTDTYVPAASATARANSTAYFVGEIVRPATTNGHVWRCVVAGTSTTAEPAAMTTFSGAPGQTVTDGTVTWAECGRGYLKLAPTEVSAAWTSATIQARYLVIYDNTPATDAARQLLALIDLGSAPNGPSSTNGNFTVTYDTQGLLLIPIPS